MGVPDWVLGVIVIEVGVFRVLDRLKKRVLSALEQPAEEQVIAIVTNGVYGLFHGFF